MCVCVCVCVCVCPLLCKHLMELDQSQDKFYKKIKLYTYWRANDLAGVFIQGIYSLHLQGDLLIVQEERLL